MSGSSANTAGEVDRYRHQRQLIERRGLSEGDVPGNPMALVCRWRDEAAESGILVPRAMVLATVDENGVPSARTLATDECSERGITFFTNTNSLKVRHISHCKQVEGVFVWPQLSRQIRISGSVEKLSDTETTDYFDGLSEEFKVIICVSEQSASIPDRAYLEQKAKRFADEHKNSRIECPPYWGGYLLKPERVEFWQARPDILHDRILLSRSEDGAWQKERLAP